MWDYYDKWIRFSQWLISGTPSGPDQWVGTISKARNHVDSSKCDQAQNELKEKILTVTVFFCKSARALPYMSAKHRSKSWWYRLRAFFINVPIQDTGNRVIDVNPWPVVVDQEGIMQFGDKVPDDPQKPQYQYVKPDVVVFATGYRRYVPFLDTTYCQPGEAIVREVYALDEVTVGFIGFVRPGFGMCS